MCVKKLFTFFNVKNYSLKQNRGEDYNSDDKLNNFTFIFNIQDYKRSDKKNKRKVITVSISGVDSNPKTDIFYIAGCTSFGAGFAFM